MVDNIFLNISYALTVSGCAFLKYERMCEGRIRRHGVTINVRNAENDNP